MFNYPDPLDPTQVFYDPLPDNATQEDFELYQRLTLKMLLHGFITFLIIVALLALVSLFTGCTPQRIVSDTVEQRHIQEMLQRMDSLMRIKTVTQQDSTWRQEILRQFQSIRETSDTSRTLVVDTAGRVVKETLIINNVRESTSETDREERLVMMHRLEAMDSTVQAQSLQISRMDSLLRQQKQTEIKEVPAELTTWQQLQLWLGRLVLLAIALCATVFVVRWWLRVKKVI